MTIGQGRSARSAIAAKAFTRATVDPTDRSMPPVVITNVIATATISMGADWRSRFKRLPGVRNASVVAEKKTQHARKNAAIESTWALAIRKSDEREPCGRTEYAVIIDVLRPQ